MSATRKLSLPMLGLTVDAPKVGGTSSLTAVLPTARVISQAAMKHAVSERTPSCKAGCTACCHQLVPISVVEAKGLLATIKRMPKADAKRLFDRFARATETLERAGLLPARGEEARTSLIVHEDGSLDESEKWREINHQYFALRLPCPFLDGGGRCSVYAERPFVCREYLVFSDPKLCDELHPDIVPVPRPLYMTRALARLAEIEDEAHPSTVPLVLLLEWAAEFESHGSPNHPIEGSIDRLLGAIEWFPEGELD